MFSRGEQSSDAPCRRWCSPSERSSRGVVGRALHEKVENRLFLLRCAAVADWGGRFPDAMQIFVEWEVFRSELHKCCGVSAA
jgi:hypothetical protein